MAHDTDGCGSIPAIENQFIRKPDADFEIRTDSLKKLGQLGALRRAPAAPELQLDGARSWIRYHHLEYRDGALTLWTTDNRCTIYARLPVSALREVSWSANVDSALFNTIMSLIPGPKYRVVLEEKFLLLNQVSPVVQLLAVNRGLHRASPAPAFPRIAKPDLEYEKNLRLPIRPSLGEFRTPPQPSVDSRYQVSRNELIRVLTCLVGGTPNPSASDPCEFDKTQTVSLYQDGLAIAFDRGVERLATTSPLPYDVHVARIYARRLNEWLQLLDSDISMSRVEASGTTVFSFGDAAECHRMWIPARPDGGIRQKLEAERRPAVLLAAQLSRRPLLESLRILSAVAFQHRVFLDFSVEDSATAGLRLVTAAHCSHGERISSADASHMVERFSKPAEIPGPLRFLVSLSAFRRELDRFSTSSVVIVCRQLPGGLSLLPAGDPPHELSLDEIAKLTERASHTESVLRAKPASEPEGAY